MMRQVLRALTSPILKKGSFLPAAGSRERARNPERSPKEQYRIFINLDSSAVRLTSPLHIIHGGLILEV
jgi:hypothetical protein